MRTHAYTHVYANSETLCVRGYAPVGTHWEVAKGIDCDSDTLEVKQRTHSLRVAMSPRRRWKRGLPYGVPVT